MSICMSQKPSKTVRTLKRALRAVGLSTAVAFVGLSAASPPARTTATAPAPHDFIPAPVALDVSAGRVDVPCTPRNVAQTDPGLPDADPAQWSRLVPILHAWGNKYYRFTGPGCTVEWSFVIRQWQAVVGHPVTGVLTAKDLQALATAVRQPSDGAAVTTASPPPAVRTSANAALRAGQVWSGGYRCAAINGRASLEVTRFEPIAERPGWQRIEATLTIEESGRRGVARFAGNNPTQSERFLIGLGEWVEKPVGVEFKLLRLHPMRNDWGLAQLGVNVHGRPECTVNGVDTFSFMAAQVRSDRAAQPETAKKPQADPDRQTKRRQLDLAEMDERARMQQDALDEMHQRGQENLLRQAAEDRRRIDEEERAQREAVERANEIRRRQVEQWEAEERRRRGW